MSNYPFLRNFLQVAYSVTDAERGLAVDPTHTIVHSINVPDDQLQSDYFMRVVEHALETVQDSNQPELTNDQIIRDEDIPSTNEYYNLRLILTIPLGEHGAVLVDRLLKNGVFLPTTVERLGDLADYLISDNLTHLSADEMTDRYQTL